MGEFDDANSSLTYLHSKHLRDSSGSVHETGSTVYSGDMTCRPILNPEMLSEPEAASANGLLPDLIMSVESVAMTV